EAYFYYFNKNELQAMRSGPWKLIFPHEYRTLAGAPGGKDGIPAKYTTAKAGLELYNLENDIGESTNVAASHPDIIARLSMLADHCRDDLGDALTGRVGNGIRPPGQLPASAKL